jgi:hypothetical protein
MGLIKIYDGIINEQKSKNWYDIVLDSASFKYGERDNKKNEPTGLTIDFKKSNVSPIIKKINDELLFLLNKIDPNFTIENCDRSYLNFFIKREMPYFHTDGDVTTCMFYINPKYELDEGGETQFYVDGNIKGVCPVPGRLVVFDGNITHKATSFKNHPRLTFVYKFRKK